MPVHCTDVEHERGDDDNHDECAVCLDRLCMSSERLSQISVSRRRCAVSLSAYRLRPKASLSAARMCGFEVCKESLIGIWGRMATLPCGHRFHTGCIHGVTEVRSAVLQCPTCRHKLGDEWGDAQPEHKMLYKLGVGSIGAFYCIVSLWHWWPSRPSWFPF